MGHVSALKTSWRTVLIARQPAIILYCHCTFTCSQGQLALAFILVAGVDQSHEYSAALPPKWGIIIPWPHGTVPDEWGQSTCKIQGIHSYSQVWHLSISASVDAKKPQNLWIHSEDFLKPTEIICKIVCTCSLCSFRKAIRVQKTQIPVSEGK